MHVKEEYLLHKQTGRIIKKSSKALPKGELVEYIPPKFLRKIDGVNKGKLFPWSFYMAQMKDMVPYTGDPDKLPPLPEAHIPTGKRGFVPDLQPTEDELLESDELMPVPEDEPVADEEPTGDETEDTEENLRVLDRLCKQNGSTRLEEIAAAISRLDPGKDFGKKGLPRMESLYRETGDDNVGYQEMQAAWQMVKNEAK